MNRIRTSLGFTEHVCESVKRLCNSYKKKSQRTSVYFLDTHEHQIKDGSTSGISDFEQDTVPISRVIYDSFNIELNGCLTRL